MRQRDYAAAAFEDGEDHDATVLDLRAGATRELTPTVRGEATLGYARLETDGRGLEDLNHFVYDANVTWEPSALTTLQVTASRDVDPTSTSGVAGALQHQVGLRVDHDLRRFWTVTGLLTWSREDFDQIDTFNQQIDASVEMTYLINRELAILARYAYTDFDSSFDGGDYTANRVRIGARISR